MEHLPNQDFGKDQNSEKHNEETSYFKLENPEGFKHLEEMSAPELLDALRDAKETLADFLEMEIPVHDETPAKEILADIFKIEFPVRDQKNVKSNVEMLMSIQNEILELETEIKRRSELN